LIKELEECGENLNISSRPNALILFNPAVTLLSIDGKYEFPASKTETMEERTGVPPRQLSPYHHINRGLPPTIIFHGTEDDAVHYETVALFEKKMLEVGNLCKLVSFPGEPHGFFNFGRGGNENFRKTMVAADMFLQDLGWLNGQENVDAFLERN
jgi:acetyl esterase